MNLAAAVVGKRLSKTNMDTDKQKKNEANRLAAETFAKLGKALNDYYECVRNRKNEAEAMKVVEEARDQYLKAYKKQNQLGVW